MALSKNLKRKVNSENRIFHDEWTENYAFILPSFINAKPTCLICNEGVSACKEYNIRRHHETKHANFKVAFPQKTEARKRKIEVLKGAYAHSNRIRDRNEFFFDRHAQAFVFIMLQPMVEWIQIFCFVLFCSGLLRFDSAMHCYQFTFLVPPQSYKGLNNTHAMFETRVLLFTVLCT